MFPGFTLDQLRAHVLDPFDVALALANPDEAACFSVLPNARLAAGLASAYNDWLVEHWLRHEPRLRGSMVVPAQWPEAAAAEIRRLAPSGAFATVFLPGPRGSRTATRSTTRSGRPPPTPDCRSSRTCTTRASARPGR